MGNVTLSSMISTISDTIVAPATTYGKSSLNVIRLSGSKALSIASQLTRKPASFFTPRYAHLTPIYFSSPKQNLLDECIILYFKSPKSYTTEDVIEFQCHGGFFIAKSIIEECLKLGARIAKGGEFTQRAFLGGRIDLSQAQAIAKLIETSNSQAHQMLMRHLKGEMQDFCNHLREELLKILAHSEVLIDYAEEDLPPTLLEDLQAKIQKIQSQLHNLLEQSQQKQSLFEGYKLCIIGKPNVGKSSLLNAFLRNNRAIVSEIAGTTRDSIEENFILKSHLLRIIDTAGIRTSGDIIEQEGIKRTFQKAKESDLILALFDTSRPLDEEDKEVLTFLHKWQQKKKIIVLLNKTDLQNQLDLTLFKPFNPLPLCLKNTNLEEENSLLSKLKEHLANLLDTESENENLLLTSQYQFQAVNSILQSIQDSLEPLKYGELELFSFHINQAIQSVASLTQPYEYSQMLDVMFQDFCLGK